MTSHQRVEPTTRFVVSLAAVAALGPLAIDMYLPSILEMSEELQTGYTEMQLTLSVYLLMLGAGQLVFGPVVDTFGRRLPLLLGLVGYLVTSAVASLSLTFEMLIVGRILQGLFASLLLVVVMSATRDVAKGDQAAKIFALLMTIQGFAPIIAPTVGGYIGEMHGWRGVFLAMGIAAGLVLLVVSFTLPETLPSEKRVPLNFKRIARDYKDIVLQGDFMFPAAALTTVFIFLFGYVGGASYAFQTVYGLDVRTFGYVFGGAGAAVLVGAMSVGKLVSWTKITNVAIIGVAFVVGGMMISLFSVATGIGLYGVVLGVVFSLFGIGISEATLMSIAMSMRDTAVGASAAVLGVFQLGLGGMSTPIGGSLVEGSISGWLFYLATAGALALMLTFLLARRVERKGISIALTH